MVGKLFILSAPSGAGKTTLTCEIIKKYSDHYKLDRVITYTSRLARPGEIHGRDYYFIDSKEFERRIQAGFFLEYSTVYGTYYGSPCSILETLNQGISLLAILDIQGAQELIKKVPNAICIWLQVSIALLKKRLLLRNTETDVQRIKRLTLAQEEINQEKVNNFYHYRIPNDNLQKSLKIFEAIFKAHL